MTESLPFRLKRPGSDTIDLEGARSVSYRIEGLLHLFPGVLSFEWAGTKHVEQVSLSSVDVDTQQLPYEFREVAIGDIADIRRVGGWWAPRVIIRARRLDAFEGIPGARPGVVTLKIRLRDRELADALIVALEEARADAALEAADRGGELEARSGHRRIDDA